MVYFNVNSKRFTIQLLQQFIMKKKYFRQYTYFISIYTQENLGFTTIDTDQERKNYLFFQQKHFLIQAQQAMFDAMITKATKIMVRNTHSRGKHLPTITLRRDFACLWQYEISS